MKQTIKTWRKDGFDLEAYHEPDETGLRPEDVEEGPRPDDTEVWADTWYSRLNEYEQGTWYYVDVVVEVSREGVVLATATLGGVESDASEYHEQVADELAEDAIWGARETLRQLAEDAREEGLV